MGTNLITMVAAGGGKLTFTAEDAMKTARGFHHAAGELEALQERVVRKRLIFPNWVPLSWLVTVSKTSIGRRLVWLISNGLHFGRHYLFGADLPNPNELIGRMAGAVVLEALAVEMALKARLLRAKIAFPRGKDGHDHTKLYALVPDTE